MPSYPLSNVDTAWLRMEEPDNLMMITGVMVFAQRMDYAALSQVIARRLLVYDRFSQRVVERKLRRGVFRWEDDPHFDLAYHIQRVGRPIVAGQAGLQSLVSELMSTPLDFAHPLWQMHLVEKYEDGSALICRLHHCIADGIALMQVLLGLTDESPQAEKPAPGRRRPRGKPAPLDKVQAAYQAAVQLREVVLHEGLERLVDPSRAVDLARLSAASLASSAAALGRLALRPPDPPTIFKGRLGMLKQAAWSDPIPLQEIKAIGRATGGTVNDVLLTAMSGALRQYLLQRGQAVAGLNVRAVVPVNLRPDGLPGTSEALRDLGNKFGLVFLTLPVGIEDTLQRLRALKRRMDALKSTPEAMVAFGILNMVGMAPNEIQELVTNLFQTKATTVMTNVPGPRQTRYLAGAPVETIMFWVPQSGRLGLGISIFSYAGQVWLGVASDQGLVPDPQAITAAFHQEFEQMKAMARGLEQHSVRYKLDEMKSLLDQALADLDELQK